MREVAFGLKDIDSLLTLKQSWNVEKNEQKSMISALRVVPIFV